ncbi:MAG: ABC transporter ATP-binding protein [Firmicutes bacterium]|nr:ABC transporter ATP-binding protein [Bacillota bacterium]
MASVHLVICDLTCSYGSSIALDGITFQVERGDLVGLIGPNGSGKSTLLKAISRVLRPRLGEILLDGKNLSLFKQVDVARRMAAVAQENPVDFDFTVEDMVLMGRYPHLSRFERERAGDFEKVRQAMEMTGTSSLAHRPVTELSGGELQRVMIARAIAQEPEVLLLDEPTSHLDIGHQIEILDMVKGLNKGKGLTVIAALHDLNLAALYFDRLILIKEGKIFALGSPAEVITRDNIRATYGSEVFITRHILSGRPQVVLLSGPGAEPGAGPVDPAGRGTTRVHVIGGGGMGAALLEGLVNMGFRVTAGVLNIGDSDWEAARALGVDVVEAPPFSYIGEEEHQRNLEVVRESDVIVLANIPFGNGNLRNLDVAIQAADAGKVVVVINASWAGRRDYTGGEGTRKLEQLLERPVIVAPDDREALEILAQRPHRPPLPAGMH